MVLVLGVVSLLSGFADDEIVLSFFTSVSLVISAATLCPYSRFSHLPLYCLSMFLVACIYSFSLWCCNVKHLSWQSVNIHLFHHVRNILFFSLWILSHTVSVCWSQLLISSFPILCNLETPSNFLSRDISRASIFLVSAFLSLWHLLPIE